MGGRDVMTASTPRERMRLAGSASAQGGARRQAVQPVGTRRRSSSRYGSAPRGFACEAVSGQRAGNPRGEGGSAFGSRVVNGQPIEAFAPLGWDDVKVVRARSPGGRGAVFSSTLYSSPPWPRRRRGTARQHAPECSCRFIGQAVESLGGLLRNHERVPWLRD